MLRNMQPLRQAIGRVPGRCQAWLLQVALCGVVPGLVLLSTTTMHCANVEQE